MRKAFNDLQLKTFYQRGFKVLLVDKTELSAEIVTISDRYDLVLLEAVSKLFDDSFLPKVLCEAKRQKIVTL